MKMQFLLNTNNSIENLNKIIKKIINNNLCDAQSFIKEMNEYFELEKKKLKLKQIGVFHQKTSKNQIFSAIKFSDDLIDLIPILNLSNYNQINYKIKFKKLNEFNYETIKNISMTTKKIIILELV